MRLIDFDVTTVNGQRRWCGVWRSGSDGYYLWINANWSSFIAKWSALAAQGLRLVGVRYYDGLWAGIWRSGTDGYYFWADANESSFLAKWGGLANQNLRLIDVIATPFGGAVGSDANLTGTDQMSVLLGRSELSSGCSGVDSTTPLFGRSEMRSAASEGAMLLRESDDAGTGGGSVDLAGTAATQSSGVGAGGGSVDLVGMPVIQSLGIGAGGGGVPLPDTNLPMASTAVPVERSDSAPSEAASPLMAMGTGEGVGVGRGVHLGVRSRLSGGPVTPQ
jgi:hypothetical protein